MAKKTVDLEAKTVTFDFGDGNLEVFELSKCSKAMVIQLALHGGSQKVGDSYASAKKICADTDIDPNEWSRSQAASVVGQIYEDDWTVRTAGAGTITDLTIALAEAAGCTVEDATTRLAEIEKDERASLRKHPDIAAVLTRIKAERATAKAKDAAKKAGTGDNLQDFMAA